MNPKNPKDLYGINIPEKTFWIPKEASPIPVYHTCTNCGNKWQTEIKVIAVIGNMTSRKYDYCSECYKTT